MALSISSFNHVTFTTRELDLAQSFYERLFGFELISRPKLDVDGRWLCHTEAGLQVHLIESSKLATALPFDPDGDLVCLAVRDLAAIQAKLASIRLPHIQYENGLYLRDPCGTLFRLIDKPTDDALVDLSPQAVPDVSDGEDEQDPFNDQHVPASPLHDSLAPPTDAQLAQIDQPLPLRRLCYIALSFHDLPAALYYYQRFLGFHCLTEHKRVAWLHHPRCGLLLRLTMAARSAPLKPVPPLTPAQDHLSFHVDCLASARQRMQQRGMAHLLRALTDANITQLFFYDSEGHMIELCNCDDVDEAFAPPDTFFVARDHKAAACNRKMHAHAWSAKKSEEQ